MKSSKPETASLPKRHIDTRKDIQTLRSLIPELDDDGVLAVYMRFWECMTIQEIAKVLGRTWDETDNLIERSIQNLREGFLAHGMMKVTAAA
jgi:DNA-directed RNA polymerase specialized sigma24 family protein